MKILRSAFRRHSSHSTTAPSHKQKRALLIGIKYDTPGSLKCDAFGELGGPHDDVYALRRLLIGLDLLRSDPREGRSAH